MAEVTVSTQAKHFLTIEEYLEIERTAEVRSEYLNGEMFAMAGGTPAHARIGANLIATLDRVTRSGDCNIYTSDLRILVEKTGLYTYPDVAVVCGEPRNGPKDRHSIVNPAVLVEVLSPTTEAYDRGKKFKHYRTIESLRAYMLVASTEVSVEVYTRGTGENWQWTSSDQLETSLDIGLGGGKIELSDIYRNVDFSRA